MPPVVATSKYFLISIYRQDIYLIAASTGEIPPLLAIEFLHRVFEIFEEYFGNVEELTIKDNFAMVYQLLEEMMDFGYPLTTEPNALKDMIRPASVISRLLTSVEGITGNTDIRSNISDVLPDGTLSNMPWRKTGVKYSQNEIYLDIIEEIDSIIDKHGFVVSSDVFGYILANSRLSGVPDLSLTFSDPSVIDDCSFHPCVRYNRFERDKIVSFVPPDGTFELMRYKITNKSKFFYFQMYSNIYILKIYNTYSYIVGPIVAPCYCQPIFTLDSGNGGHGSANITVGCRQTSSIQFPNMKKNAIVVCCCCHN